MRSTLILEVNDELSQFIQNQQGLVDPSALVNKLLREEREREGIKAQSVLRRDDIQEAMEDFLDEDIPAAG